MHELGGAIYRRAKSAAQDHTWFDGRYPHPYECIQSCYPLW